ncbi:MAG: formate/nitrite transporter family protein [Oscillospiraceae bacterium]|jgi:formate/nitrite transporter FocA (FNT family)|nr:formate/nitrite transporter family protein [Oscillospiraceae bacterium]
MLKLIIDGIKAGIMIAIGGSVFLSCENRYIGAILFSVALLCICLKGYSLFTGKVGYLPENHSKEAVKILLCGLLGNIVSTILLGYAVSFANPALGEAAKVICEAKLSQEALQTFVRAFFCGVLMYMAVSTYREKGTLAGIFFCVPVFILSGFEHSIANMFYFGASGIINMDSIIYLAVVIAGNSVGGMAMPILNILGKGEPKNA